MHADADVIQLKVSTLQLSAPCTLLLRLMPPVISVFKLLPLTDSLYFDRMDIINYTISITKRFLQSSVFLLLTSVYCAACFPKCAQTKEPVTLMRTLQSEPA